MKVTCSYSRLRANEELTDRRELSVTTATGKRGCHGFNARLNWGMPTPPQFLKAPDAPDNLVNSAAALIGTYAFWPRISGSAPIWMMAVAIGGLSGAILGSRFLSEKWLRAILALLLAGSGLKLIWWICRANPRHRPLRHQAEPSCGPGMETD